jgi:hypothetical protein
MSHWLTNWLRRRKQRHIDNGVMLLFTNLCTVVPIPGLILGGFPQELSLAVLDNSTPQIAFGIVLRPMMYTGITSIPTTCKTTLKTQTQHNKLYTKDT